MKPSSLAPGGLSCAWPCFIVTSGNAAESFVNFEGEQTRQCCGTPEGGLLFAINTPNSRWSVFDISVPEEPTLVVEIPVGLEPVSVNAATDHQVGMVNEVSARVSIVSVSRRAVVETLQVKDEPAHHMMFVNRPDVGTRHPRPQREGIHRHQFVQ